MFVAARTRLGSLRKFGGIDYAVLFVGFHDFVFGLQQLIGLVKNLWVYVFMTILNDGHGQIGSQVNEG